MLGDEPSEYILDDIWAEMEKVGLNDKLRITRMIKEYGDARIKEHENAKTEWLRPDPYF